MTSRNRLFTLLALFTLPACASSSVSRQQVSLGWRGTIGSPASTGTCDPASLSDTGIVKYDRETETYVATAPGRARIRCAEGIAEVDVQPIARLDLAVPEHVGRGQIKVIRVYAFNAKGFPLDVGKVDWTFSGAIESAACPPIHPHSAATTCSGSHEAGITGVTGGVGTVTVRVGAVTEVRQVAVAEEISKCTAMTKELKSYLSKVFDPAVRTVPAPWPTGDAVRDRQIDVFRMTTRQLMASPAPDAPAKLSAGTKPGALEHALATCKPALDQLGRVGKSDPDRRVQTMVEIADAITTCQCSIDVPLVTALLYISQRGPD